MGWPTNRQKCVVAEKIRIKWLVTDRGVQRSHAEYRLVRSQEARDAMAVTRSVVGAIARIMTIEIMLHTSFKSFSRIIMNSVTSVLFPKYLATDSLSTFLRSQNYGITRFCPVWHWRLQKGRLWHGSGEACACPEAWYLPTVLSPLRLSHTLAYISWDDLKPLREL